MKKLQNVSMAVAMAMFAHVAIAAPAQQDPKTQVLLEQLQGQIHGTMLAIAELEQQEGRASQDFKYSWTMPSKDQANIGLVLDVNQPAQGYQVLSVTPGSTADVLGITSGDFITKINGISVNSENSQTINLLKNLRGGDMLELTINNSGKQRQLSTKVASLKLPSVSFTVGAADKMLANSDPSSCGNLTIFNKPPAARDIHPVTVAKIDGERSYTSLKFIKLPVGKHIIHLHEYISDPRVRRPNGIQKSKPIEIEIKANMKYHLGAQFNSKLRYKTKKELFWTPVVWKISQRKCQL